MRKLKSYLSYTILPLVLVFITEALQRGSLLSVLKWPILHPAEFFVSYLLALSLLGVLLALTNHLRGAFFTVFTISLLFALISNIKQKFLGEPLLPWDFVLGKETTDIINYFADFINTKVLLFVVFLVILGVVLFRYLPRQKHSRKFSVAERIIFLLVSLVLISSVYSGKPIPFKKTFGLQCITWDQKLNSAQNGLLLSFITNLQWLSVDAPAAYSEESIKAIMNKYTKNSAPTASSPVNTALKEKPNIIVIMSEAFWDPSVLPGITFNQDPLPFFHTLQEKHNAGSLLVPVFGGATVNTEFEVLTGHSTHFLPGGSIAYAQYVRKPVESLASILANQGYKTTAIHSYHNWFYRRDQVFRNFGFAKFISSEFFVDPQYKRTCYISDRDVSQLIIEEAQKSTDPCFVFAVTMQNHGPYVIGYGEEAKIEVKGDLSPEAKSLLEIYAQGLADADQALQMLVEHFEKSDRPTIIVFFGDHLPSLGEDYQVYRETNFYQANNSYEEYQKMYSVPALIWSNYLPRTEEFKFNASFLGPYVLQKAGLQGSFYTEYLSALGQKAPVFPPRAYYKQAGIENSVLEDYRLLQYDLLFGQGYLYQGNPPPIIQEGYFLGQEKLMMEQVRWVAGERGKEKLEISGQNFTPDCQVYLKDKAVKTTFEDENHLTIAPSKSLLKQQDLTIQIKLRDSLNNIIAESNCALLSKMLK